MKRLEETVVETVKKMGDAEAPHRQDKEAQKQKALQLEEEC